MIAAVVPVKNEGTSLAKVLETLSCSNVDIIIPVLNGCSDESMAITKKNYKKKITPIVFSQPLGIDVPRAVGAKQALDMHASVVVFMDGDMRGPILNQINMLIEGIRSRGLDMALTDCYQNYFNSDPLAQLVLYFRKELNMALGLFPEIGVACPSHGPHAVSCKLLREIPLKELAIPPVSLALAGKAELHIGVAASIPHCLLGSNLRSQKHVTRVAETIIGDCIEALEVYNGQPRTRTYKGQVFLGYHPNRDFKTLANFLA